jgi:hypothetical protein
MQQHTLFAPLNYLVRVPIFLTLLVFVDPCPATSPCRPSTSDQNVTAEEWIRHKLEAGDSADLDCYSSDPTHHIVRSSFLQSLLTGSGIMKDFQLHRHGFNLQHAVIQGEFELRNVEIPYDVSLTDSDFQDRVDFTQTTFKKSLHLERNEFHDRVTFLYCNINLSLEMKNARFDNPSEDEAPYYFGGMRVGTDVDISDAVFVGAANFVATEIGGDLIAYRTKFRKFVSFESIKVGRNGLFHQAEFDARARFTGAEFSESMEAYKAKFLLCPNDKKNRSRFDDMKVGTLLLDINSFPKPPCAAPDLGGMRFDNILLNDGDRPLEGLESNQKLIDLLRPSEQPVDFDSRLADYFAKLGDSDQADRLFIAQKQRERETYLKGFAWWKSYFLDFLVGYGRQPWKAFLFSLLVVGIGCLVFREKDGMELQQERNGQRSSPMHVYNAFWYSVDLFAPVIDLKTASVWVPKRHRRFARNYVYLHRILGWILIPIGLAALSGLISR